MSEKYQDNLSSGRPGSVKAYSSKQNSQKSYSRKTRTLNAKANQYEIISQV